MKSKDKNKLLPRNNPYLKALKNNKLRLYWLSSELDINYPYLSAILNGYRRCNPTLEERLKEVLKPYLLESEGC
jgi:hypothetical protein